MLQIMDLAKENGALRSELVQLRQETQELQRRFSRDADGSSQASDMGAATRFWQIITGG
jgi:hypothetical protein